MNLICIIIHFSILISLSKIIKKLWQKNFSANKCHSSLIFATRCNYTFSKFKKKIVTESVNFISKEDKNYEHFPMKTTVIKYHCHKHASFLPILFCVYSVVWKKLFIWNFLLCFSKTIYATHTIFRFSLSFSFFFVVYTVFSALYNKKKRYLRFSLFNFFSTFLMIFHWHFPVCTILFWILLLVTLSCYWTFFFCFMTIIKMKMPLRREKKMRIFDIQFLWLYEMANIVFSIVCLFNDERCAV